MKVWCYVAVDGRINIYDAPKGYGDLTFLGTLYLDIKPEKKWVKKSIARSSGCMIPVDARNVMITYEVEE